MGLLTPADWDGAQWIGLNEGEDTGVDIGDLPAHLFQVAPDRQVFDEHDLVDQVGFLDQLLRIG